MLILAVRIGATITGTVTTGKSRKLESRKPGNSFPGFFQRSSDVTFFATD
jgi:hypothetical protein